MAENTGKNERILTNGNVKDLLDVMINLSRAARDLALEGSLETGRCLDAVDYSLRSMKEATRYGNAISWDDEISLISERVRAVRESAI